MKKGQEPGQLDKEAVGRITCRILQEEEPGSMLVKKLWRLAGMLICLLCLTGGLCSAFLSGFGIRYSIPVFWMLLIVSVLFWIAKPRCIVFPKWQPQQIPSARCQVEAHHRNSLRSG